MPKISLLVVINGPVAMAGSMPLLSRIIGTKVPTKAATIITHIIEIATVKLNRISILIKNPAKITKRPSTTPLIKLSPTSLSICLKDFL